MKRELDIEQLLRWRLERAEAEAPVPPRASRLLGLVRPALTRLDVLPQVQGDVVARTVVEGKRD